jgi:hypothetical protein
MGFWFNKRNLGLIQVIARNDVAKIEPDAINSMRNVTPIEY